MTNPTDETSVTRRPETGPDGGLAPRLHPGAPQPLQEALGEHFADFEAYLRSPDRDTPGRSLALLDLAADRALRAALKEDSPEYRKDLYTLAKKARLSFLTEQGDLGVLLAELEDMARRGATAAASWEAVSKIVERREQLALGTRRVALGQGAVITAAAIADALNEIVRAIVEEVTDVRLRHRLLGRLAQVFGVEKAAAAAAAWVSSVADEPPSSQSVNQQSPVTS